MNKVKTKMKVQAYVSSEDGKLFDVSINTNEVSFVAIELTEEEISELTKDIFRSSRFVEGNIPEFGNGENKMSFRISLTKEQHGDTIRLEKNVSQFDELKHYVEKFETVEVLLISQNSIGAMETFDTLNSFIRACVDAKIFLEDMFQYDPIR